MQVVFCGVYALSVAVIYYSWRGYYQNMLGRHKMLRERVTYMLWVMADAVPE